MGLKRSDNNRNKGRCRQFLHSESEVRVVPVLLHQPQALRVVVQALSQIKVAALTNNSRENLSYSSKSDKNESNYHDLMCSKNRRYVSLRLFGGKANTQCTVYQFLCLWMVQIWIHSLGAALKVPSPITDGN